MVNNSQKGVKDKDNNDVGWPIKQEIPVDNQFVHYYKKISIYKFK